MFIIFDIAPPRTVSQARPPAHDGRLGRPSFGCGVLGATCLPVTVKCRRPSVFRKFKIYWLGDMQW